MKLIDIHQHIVFGVDDGAKDPRQSYAMLRTAMKNGVSDIICTSHWRAATATPEMVRAYRTNFHCLQTLVREKKLPIRLHSGSEIMYSADLPELLGEGKVRPLAESGYLLIEFLPNVSYEQVLCAVRNITYAGYVPVLAHVERYDCLREGDRLRELKESFGVWTQMNASTAIRACGSLIGGYRSRKLIRSGLIDIVASDAHNTDTRPCALREAYKAVKERFGESIANRLCRGNPGRILSDGKS